MKFTERIGRLLVVPLLALCSSIAGGAESRPRLIQSVDIQIPVDPSPLQIAGKTHLVYELHITNFTSSDIALTRVEVLDADRGTHLADFRDAALADKLGRPGLQSTSGNTQLVAGGMRAVMYLWLTLDDATPTPARVRHSIEFDAVRPSGREHGVVRGGELQVRDEPPAALNAPLRGGPWVALYDPSMARGHRTSIYTLEGRARIPARFAVDWIRLNDDATHASGDSKKVANWHGYGAEVLAVADGVVAQARDDMSALDFIDESQGPMPLENASGNHVTLDLGRGRYAFYEHLQHGSITVKTGDRVKSGQVIGRLGNSGSSSSGPHLHFHVADAPSTLAAEGLPYVFRSFDIVGGYEKIGDFASGERWKAVPPDEGGARTMELPDANVVVIFPAE